VGAGADYGCAPAVAAGRRSREGEDGAAVVIDSERLRLPGVDPEVAGAEILCRTQWAARSVKRQSAHARAAHARALLGVFTRDDHPAAARVGTMLADYGSGVGDQPLSARTREACLAAVTAFVAWLLNATWGQATHSSRRGPVISQPGTTSAR
jgi:hypothetical protein